MPHHSSDSEDRKRKPPSRSFLEPAELKLHKIIVGVDYGTTFSGMLLRIPSPPILEANEDHSRSELRYNR
jgi:hypothetical protein